MAEQRAKMVLMQRQQENNVMNITPRIGGGPKIGGGTGSGKIIFLKLTFFIFRILKKKSQI